MRYLKEDPLPREQLVRLIHAATRASNPGNSQGWEFVIIDNPDILLKLASSFVEAGSDIILTCTFGGTRMRMKDSNYQDRAPEVNIRAAEIARQAASARDGVLVAGSMGPVGALIKPYGPLEAEDLKATFAEQAKALAEGGVDLLLIETMFAFEETTAAFEGASAATDLPIVVSFSYDRGTRTMMGVKPKDVIKRYCEDNPHHQVALFEGTPWPWINDTAERLMPQHQACRSLRRPAILPFDNLVGSTDADRNTFDQYRALAQIGFGDILES